MRRTLSIASLLLLLTVLASAADVSGTWKGAFDFQGTSVPLTFVLKGAPDAVTGTVEGLPAGVAEIKGAKLDGDALTFWLTTEYEGNPIKLVYKGKVAGDQIQFTFGTEDGNWGTELTAKRTT